MLSLRNFWRRHKRKILITSGVLGSGYFLCKLYNAHQQKLADLERELARQRANDELIKAQLQDHFENVQLIADTTTLPHAMQYLRTRIAEELDLSQLTERLQKGKDQPTTLTSSEKLELWDRLKILSFTQMLVSLWAVTMLSLYIKVQVNILGRHLYIDTARGLGSSLLLENVDLVDRDDQQNFLASADFLANNGLLALIPNIQAVVTEVLEGKKLTDLFNTTSLHETVMQILNKFMSMGSPHQWIDYLMPEDCGHYKLGPSSSIDDMILPDSMNFDQLMVEARAVLSSAEFGKIMEISLKVAVDALVDDMEAQSQSTGASLTLGMPLAKLLSRVLQIIPSLLGEASQNQIIQIIRNLPEVELFFTLLYANNLLD
ncbi:PREDICTED: peroxisome biogenesis protein 3-2 [Populus euphratica]|uniref:Peroxisome biogenesis protein 3-2 n=1 Tax=Populus euphratica TaxID=75702 RepID=A0AAJ6SXH6_POPEU|nr:PREDICTED: peroxisome biogenesis protein 3-2 [Populus euphratica]